VTGQNYSQTKADSSPSEERNKACITMQSRRLQILIQSCITERVMASEKPEDDTMGGVKADEILGGKKETKKKKNSEITKAQTSPNATVKQEKGDPVDKDVDASVEDKSWRDLRGGGQAGQKKVIPNISKHGIP